MQEYTRALSSAGGEKVVEGEGHRGSFGVSGGYVGWAMDADLGGESAQGGEVG